MKEAKTEGRRFALRRSDKIILCVIGVMVALTIALGILQRVGLSLINASVGLLLPVFALFALVGWCAFALIRRIRRVWLKLAVGGVVGLVLLIALMLGFSYINLVGYTALPHAYKVVVDPSGKRQLVVMWRFEGDAEHYQETIEARKAARRERYPDSTVETISDDVCVAFDAYPRVMGLFYRSNADVEGQVYLAYSGNIVSLNTLESAGVTEVAEEEPAAADANAEEEAVGAAEAADEAAEEAGAEAAQAQYLDTPHGTMMLEWLDDNTTAHFYVKDPGVAEGGECTVRLGK